MTTEVTTTPAPTEDVRAAIRTAYGHLWRVLHPSTDVIMARKALLAVMTAEEQRAAIHELYARGHAPRQPEGYA